MDIQVCNLDGTGSTLLMTPRVSHGISFEFMSNQIWRHRSNNARFAEIITRAENLYISKIRSEQMGKEVLQYEIFCCYSHSTYPRNP